MEYSSSSSSSSSYSCKMLLVLLFLISFCIVPVVGGRNDSAAAAAVEVHVGLIHDSSSIIGKMAKTSISMGLEDFYAIHPNYSTRLVLHPRDSKGDVVQAASAAIDLLKNVLVQAILGPPTSTQANFVIRIGNKTQVPIISQATSPTLSPKENPYFIRTATIGSSHVGALASIIKAFSWREVVLIYEDSCYGSGIVPPFIDALISINTQVRYRSVISTLATDDHIFQELHKLQTMQTRVFVVHMLLPLASRLFLKAKAIGMMSEGYAWITTDGLTSLLDFVHPTSKEAMQGVIGIKPYVPWSKELDNFKQRWRKRFLQENPDMESQCEINAYGLWAYSSVKALAMAVEKARIAKPRFKKPNTNYGHNLTNLAAIGTSKSGPKLLQSIRNMRFNDLSGEFNLIDGELDSSTFQIVNVIGKQDVEIGLWTPKYGIENNLIPRNKNHYTTNKEDLKAIIWPGESNIVPKGWEMPKGEKKLRVGVPVKNGFYEFIKVEKDPKTNIINATGFCVDVFKEVMDHSLLYDVPYEFIPFPGPNGDIVESYDNLVYQIALDKFDVVVGDVTILANRSNFVDFTLPFIECGVAMIVPIENNEQKNVWIFMKPLTMNLWLTIGSFFIFIGFVIWVLEHRVNKEFRGPPRQQLGMIFWFSFSTLVFAHKEKVVNNLSRFVLVVWVFVVLVLTSSYTASLTSMLTVEKLQPNVTDINDLIKNGDYIGYQEGSFVGGFLKSLHINPSKIKTYVNLQEYDEALSKGSKNGGVAAIVDELPFLRLLLSKYCSKYVIVGPTYQTEGFGFAFKKGSPLIPDVSRAILSIKEGEKINKLLAKWFGKEQHCPGENGMEMTSGRLSLNSFKGLFLIAVSSSLSAFIVFMFIFLRENKATLASTDSIWKKVATMAKNFDEQNDGSSNGSKHSSIASSDGGTTVPTTTNTIFDCPQSPSPSPTTSYMFHNADEMSSQEEGFSTTQPSTPIHDGIVTI